MRKCLVCSFDGLRGISSVGDLFGKEECLMKHFTGLWSRIERTGIPVAVVALEELRIRRRRI